jgi:ABC-type nitrate/sulfonate/bicarbonate transport system substrate-binding protein
MNKKYVYISVAAIMAVVIVGYIFYGELSTETSPSTTESSSSLTQVTFAVSPFQDTLLPIVGKEKGWYREEGLDVEFKVLGWTEVMEALSAGGVDVAINNMSAVVSTHEQNPQITYWYGLNPFSDGFALMIRPDSKMKTLEQIRKEVDSYEEAIKKTAAQLKGKTVVTTAMTDMEQGVAAVAQRGGLNFKEDIRILDLNPDEGLAAFLRGEGDAYIGGVPQRSRAAKEGMRSMITGADLGPPPINGLVTTKDFASENRDVMLKLMRVWFRTVNHMNRNLEDGASIIIERLNSTSGAQFTLEDYRQVWNDYEEFPASPSEVEKMILEPGGRFYWEARWKDCNRYFHDIKGVISKPVDPKSAFWMRRAHKAYTKEYESGSTQQEAAVYGNDAEMHMSDKKKPATVQ